MVNPSSKSESKISHQDKPQSEEIKSVNDPKPQKFFEEGNSQVEKSEKKVSESKNKRKNSKNQRPQNEQSSGVMHIYRIK